MVKIREPAVAGLFYPGSREELHKQVRRFLDGAHEGCAGAPPKALIGPHAGYSYSGPVAASAYAGLCRGRGVIGRVVLLGPSHRVPLAGLAVSRAEAFRTPLGDVPLDREGIAAIVALEQVRFMEKAHVMEHSLEVHLPFLQEQLGDFTIIPLVVGEALPEEVAEVLEMLWGGPETLIVASSDLSHFLDYRSARVQDEATSRRIEALDYANLHPHQACGCRAVAGLLRAAAGHGLRPVTLDLRNSGDTAGPHDKVVGYGAWALRD